jgi:hypothetical protein
MSEDEVRCYSPFRLNRYRTSGSGSGAKKPMPELVEEPGGPYHDFWLLREDECSYAETSRYLGRRDAPVRLAADVLHYLEDALAWLPVVSPGRRTHRESQGLYFYGPNIINRGRGQAFSKLFHAWATILALGPDPLLLSAGIVWIAANEDAPEVAHVHRMQISRDQLVGDLRLLASWGSQVEAGEHYILHHGI